MKTNSNQIQTRRELPIAAALLALSVMSAQAQTNPVKLVSTTISLPRPVLENKSPGQSAAGVEKTQTRTETPDANHPRANLISYALNSEAPPSRGWGEARLTLKPAAPGHHVKSDAKPARETSVNGGTNQVEQPQFGTGLSFDTIAKPSPQDRADRLSEVSLNYSGVLAQVRTNENRLQLINPLAPARYGRGEANLIRDPVTGRASGLNLFSIKF